jgi:hypothetical protein
VADVLGAVRLSRMVDESTSPERQREQIRTWSKLHAHQVVHITEDTGVSGAIPATARPQLGPWLTDPSLSGRWPEIECASELETDQVKWSTTMTACGRERVTADRSAAHVSMATNVTCCMRSCADGCSSG